MQPWQLPEYIADILPASARQLENAKEQLLALFRVYGYELVSPPLMEYTTSLLTRIDPGLSLKTIRVVDQISGYQLGLRADITPQISRIDAHLLSAKTGVNRLCYAGAVLHARPDTLYSTREPLQVGAELYGHASLAADEEMIELMLASVRQLGVLQPVLSLGHTQPFRALAKQAGLDQDKIYALISLMQTKDSGAVAAFCQQENVNDEMTVALVALTTLYGGVEVIEKARQQLPHLPEIQAALNDLQTITADFSSEIIHIDLAELRRDHYHSGLLFAVYRDGESDAVARGGRYDGLGGYFGRARPATGFSFDLKTFLPLLPARVPAEGIWVAAEDAASAKEKIHQLRSHGEIVIIDYDGEGAASLNCNRRLCRSAHNHWQVEPL